ncbi:ExeM/NucH family extracellular endonuclease [Nocardioides sp. YIM 152588]|uniref:ExeM/NucH family extracellular endonuclease n=1 Tax=Nocardioides sp. YIM 152588 TaxID=3158259 RepID=UPI0032E46164
MAALAVSAALSGGALVAAGSAPAHADPAGTGLVISEVYGAGGNNGAVYNADYVELYNPTDAPLSLSGLAIHYRSAGGGSGGSPYALSGEVPAGSHWLIQMGSVGTNGAALPTPDRVASPSFSMASAGGQVALQEGTTIIATSGDVVGVSGLVDFFGTSGAASYEGAPAGASASSSVSLNRDADGTDTDNNGADFTQAAPSPTASGTDPEPEPEPEELAIAEIQGTGDTTPVSGQEVITSGVVTAAYPVGGFYGFYLQTPGTGGEVDLATHDASDGIFVYQRSSAGAVTVEPGDHVEVTGLAGEYAGATQLTVDAPEDIVELAEPADAPEPMTGDWPATDAERETLEGMLFAAEDAFTVTNTYSTNQYGEVGLALGDGPLVQPTDVAAPGSPEADAVAADNAARGIVLDDGSSWNYLNFSQNYDNTPPYVSNATPVVVGAAVEFTAPVILTEGGSPSSPTYRFQPLAQATDDTATWPATFEDIRTPAPDEGLLSASGTPDLKVASFNVLNYFTTLGDPDDDNVSEDGCQAYTDRDGDGNNVRTGCDQRGAWDPEDFGRQQEKIVAAINALDADVVGLMEIENSAALGEATDEATEALVAALNADAGGEVWAANPSSAELPDAAEQDVITNAIIYKPAAVERVGEARALGDQSGADQAFGNAREPIGQVFEPAAGGEPFLFVVNHFKSKGSAGPWPGDVDAGDGQGNSNESRVRQATALRDWVAALESEVGVEDTFLVGDFNAYTQEDPLHVLYDAGYADTESYFGNGEFSYSFSGLSGSLDHVLVNAGALERLTGTDIWNINSGESVAMEYSRYNYHATDFHTAEVYRSSDHDPVVVGLDDEAPETGDTPSRTSVVVTPGRIVAGRTEATVRIRVRSEHRPASGEVEVSADGATYTATLRHGRATVELPAFAEPGEYEVVVRYLGTTTTAPSEASEFVEVVAPRR